MSEAEAEGVSVPESALKRKACLGWNVREAGCGSEAGMRKMWNVSSGSDAECVSEAECV